MTFSIMRNLCLNRFLNGHLLYLDLNRYKYQVSSHQNDWSYNHVLHVMNTSLFQNSHDHLTVHHL